MIEQWLFLRPSSNRGYLSRRDITTRRVQRIGRGGEGKCLATNDSPKDSYLSKTDKNPVLETAYRLSVSGSQFAFFFVQQVLSFSLFVVSHLLFVNNNSKNKGNLWRESFQENSFLNIRETIYIWNKKIFSFFFFLDSYPLVSPPLPSGRNLVEILALPP